MLKDNHWLQDANFSDPHSLIALHFYFCGMLENTGFNLLELFFLMEKNDFILAVLGTSTSVSKAQ